ncbi:MAG: HAMP domain-containing sensor histidine kinase [Longicatena sp.]
MNPKIKKTVSVKWKIFGSMLIFTCIIIVVLWLFQVIFLEKFYVSIKSSAVKKAADEINEVINAVDYQEQINDISKQDEFCVIVYSDDGKALTSGEGDPRCRISEVSYQSNKQTIEELKLEASIKGCASKLIEESTLKDRLPLDDIQNDILNIGKDSKFKAIEDTQRKKSTQSMTYISVVKNNANQLLTILITAQLTPVNATVDTIKTQFVMIAIILIVIAIVLALFLSKKIASPIISMNKSAKVLATGDYNVRFAGKGYLEIQELNDTLNYAAGELGKVESLRRDLIANMSHDLRTPLTMISGYSEVMRDIPGENTPENVQIIIDETKRLTTLVNDMLDLSKLQAGVQKLSKEEINLTEEIQDIIHRYDKLVSDQNCHIRFDYTHHVRIEADIVKLNQVIYNLINNAINYCGEDRLVIVKQSINHDKVNIEVIDHGVGIEKEQLSHIWERYYKVDKTHVRSKVGSGLGLSIVKTILELHGAHYGVKSEVGKGSTFWFEIPYVAIDNSEEK